MQRDGGNVVPAVVSTCLHTRSLAASENLCPVTHSAVGLTRLGARSKALGKDESGYVVSTETPSGEHRALTLKVVAGVVAAVPVIRGFTGYYPSDLGWMALMLAIAAVIFFVADRIG